MNGCSYESYQMGTTPGIIAITYHDLLTFYSSIQIFLENGNLITGNACMYAVTNDKELGGSGGGTKYGRIPSIWQPQD
jgi:hypothetical protein